MRPQIATLSKLLGAYITLIRSLTCMAPNVYLQCARSHKGLLTHCAFEGSFASMPPKMVRQMSMCCERPSTVLERALEGLFSVMNAHVSLQIALFCKFLVAASFWAHKRFESALQSAKVIREQMFDVSLRSEYY